MRRFFLLLATLAGLIPADGAAAEEAAFGFSEKGLISIRYGKTEFLTSGELTVGSVQVRGSDGKLRVPAHGTPERRIEENGRRLVHEFAWGRVEMVYHTDRNRLTFALSITNTGAEPIAELALGLCQLEFSPLPAGDIWTKGFEVGGDNQGDITAAVADFRTGFMVLCNDDVTDRLLLSFVPNGENRRLIRMSTIPWTNVDEPLIAPGETRRHQISLRFDRPGVPLTTICADLYEKFLKAHPFAVKWEDRRPIGMLTLANGFHSSKTNPRGWFNDPKLDVHGERGRERFRKRLLEAAGDWIGILRGMNAQGAIIWNLEGEEFSNINYVGDPRMTAKLAPEMDAAAEELFALFRSAGLRAGVCIRPSRIVPGWDGKTAWVHDHMEFDVVAEMEQKIAYAKKRFGCTLFYVDSNSRYFRRPDGKVDSRLLEGESFRRLAKAHPDVLLIPEHATLDYWATTAPYREMRAHAGGFAATPREVLNVYPRAFSVINAIDGPIQERRAELVRAFRRGDILLFRAFFQDEQNKLFRSIMEEAARKN